MGNCSSVPDVAGGHAAALAAAMASGKGAGGGAHLSAGDSAQALDQGNCAEMQLEILERVSPPRRRPRGAFRPPGRPPANRRPPPGRVTPGGSRRGSSRRARPPDRPFCPRAPRPAQINAIQQQLALVNASPLLGLPEAVDLLAEQLGVDLAA
jgi:hypothetical protein